jgi:RNA polymerase sigma-70 factor (ECF subfamily)
MSSREDHEFAEIAAQAAWVRRLALALSREAQLGEDIAQDALLSALDRRPHSIEDLRAWLRAVVHNLTRFRHRSDAHRTEREARAARSERLEDPALAHERLEIQAQLLHAVQDLDEPYRTTVLLRWFEDLPSRTIAERTGVPVRTVHIRISRALRMLRESLDRRSHGDRSKWMAAWIPLLPKPSLSWPEVLVMTAKTKLAVTGLLLVGGLLLLAVLLPRDSSNPRPPPAIVLGREAISVPSTAAEPIEELEHAQESRAAVTETRSVATAAPALPHARKVTGIVIDTTGARLSNVTVVLHAAGSSHGADDPRTTSDASGRFEFETASSRGAFGSAGAAWMVVYEPNLRFPDPPEGYVLVIAHPIAIRGRVIDTGQHPIPGANVLFAPLGGTSRDASNTDFGVAWTDPLRATLGLPMDASKLRQWRSKTDEQGRFEIDAPDLREGMVLTVTAPSFMSAGRVLDPPREEYVFVLHSLSERRPDRLSGRVVGPRGEPVGGALVLLGSAHTHSDDRGEFVIRFQERSSATHLIAIATNWKPAVLTSLAPSPSDPGAWPSPLVLALSEPALSIEGVVVDSHATAVPNIEVRVLDPITWNEVLASVGEGPIDAQKGGDTAIRGVTNTDEHGRFELPGLLPRSYRLKASSRKSLAATISGPISAGTHDVSLVLEAPDRGCAIAGEVLDLHGKPIIGAIVRARGTIPASIPTSRPSFVDTEPVRTDEKGRFAFEEMSCDVQALVVQPEDASPGKVCPISPGQDRSKIALAVGRIGHVRVEIQNTDLVANSVSFLDAQGAKLEIGARRGGSGWISGSSLPVTSGRTEAMVISEEATTAVLLKDGSEVARAPVKIVPGETVVVRL